MKIEPTIGGELSATKSLIGKVTGMFSSKDESAPAELSDILSRISGDIKALEERASYDEAQIIEIEKSVAELELKKQAKVDDVSRGRRVASRFMELLK